MKLFRGRSIKQMHLLNYSFRRGQIQNTVYIPYFIEYNVHTSKVRTWISQWIFAKKIFLFFKNNFKRNNHCKFNHDKSYLKPFLSYLPWIVHREYFSIIFNVKKYPLNSIKYGSEKYAGCVSCLFQTLYFMTNLSPHDSAAFIVTRL